MKRFRVFAVLLAVFLAGIAGGVLATRLVIRKTIQTAIERPDEVRNRLERAVARRLDLTTDQRAIFHKQLTEAHERVQALRSEFQPRFEAILQDLETNLAPQLDAKQLERLQEMKRRHQLLLSE